MHRLKGYLITLKKVPIPIFKKKNKIIPEFELMTYILLCLV